MNRVFLKGNLARDPEIFATQSGGKLARFAIACDRGVKDANGNRQADFINCTAWDKGAELLEKYFHKGKPILVEGSLRVSSYTDKTTGQPRRSTDVNVSHIEFAGDGRGAGTGGTSPAPAAQSPAPQKDVFAEDIDPNFEPLDDSELPF